MYGAKMYRVFVTPRVIVCVCVYMYLHIGHAQQVLVLQNVFKGGRQLDVRTS